MENDLKMRLVTATFNIQRAMETLLLYSSDEKGIEYLEKLEGVAEHYLREEEKLMEK